MSKKLLPELKYHFNFKQFIQNALLEDVGDGDHSSLSCIPSTAKGKAKLLVKETGIIAGVELAQRIFKYIDTKLKVTVKIKDGNKVTFGDVVLTVEGNVQSILKAERLVLNCMQRMSGIASYTNKLVTLCEGTKTKILDTRKTTPNFRALEKWAVRIGGGANHRIGLYDMIILKDNHVDYAGGITKAIQTANDYLKKKKKKLAIEVETRTIDEIKEVLKTGKVNRIMLDNFSTADTKRAVALINGKYETESSGGITEKNIRNYALCGVDYISIGALTHSIKSLDLSLKATK